MITRSLLFTFLTISLSLTPWFGSVLAQEKIVRQDTDKDGKIDQIAHVDHEGKLRKLEVDSNADGVMDRFQYYENGQISRIERDSDGDRKIDIWDWFQEGKRVRQERASLDTGRVIQIVHFDPQERPSRAEKDTTGDGGEGSGPGDA